MISIITTGDYYGGGIISNGYFYTANHVSPTRNELVLTIQNKKYSADVIFRDKENDLLIAKPTINLNCYNVVLTNQVKYQESLTVYHPNRGILKGWAGGLVEQNKKLYRTIHITDEVNNNYAGTSGSGVYNSNNECVGIVLQQSVLKPHTLLLLTANFLKNPKTI